MPIKKYLKNEKTYFEVYVSGYNPRGDRIQRRKREVETLKKAQALEFELKREIAKIKESPIDYRWSEWLQICLKNMKLSLSPSTVINYEASLNKWATPKWDMTEIKTITKMQVYELVFEKVDKKLTDYSRKSVLKMIRRIFQMAVDEGLINRNPCQGVQVRVGEVEQKVLTNAEVCIFLREARQCEHRFYPIWFVALTTGMRSGELMALTWKNIDFDAKIISVSRQWSSKSGFASTKTQRNRVVPISDDLLHFLKELKLKSGDNEFVLPHMTDWLNGDQARITREFCMGLNITPIKFHDLRATFITNLLSRGVSLARVMAVVGHSQIKTTNGYLRKAGVDVQGTTEALGYKLPMAESEAKVYSLTEAIKYK